MTNPKTVPDQPPAPAPAQEVPLPHRLGEMAALRHLLPWSALHPSAPALPDDETVEAGFDNMPV
jgi:hypothetical protein